ncbi:hypothetical protein [Glutamicibacter creatinolyticus]|uniref:hypothetical protein n=1 Tax=Glutamicibacter creatinolyticus TaxID=162496 RepID=UPI0031D5E0D6
MPTLKKGDMEVTTKVPAEVVELKARGWEVTKEDPKPKTEPKAETAKADNKK